MAKKKGKLTESELAMLDVLILRAIEQGKPITGLFVQEEGIWDDVTNAVTNAVQRVVDFVTKVADGFNRAQQAQDDNFNRAISMDPKLQLVDRGLSEARLTSIVTGADAKLGGKMTVEELKMARRDLRALAFKRRSKK